MPNSAFTPTVVQQGIGVVQPGVADGLVSRNGVPRRADGLPVITGYVGHVTTVATFTPPTPVTGGTLQTVGSITLNKGTYVIYGQAMLAIGSGTMGADPYFGVGVSIGTAVEQAPYMFFATYSGGAGSSRCSGGVRIALITADSTPVYLVSRNGLATVGSCQYSASYCQLEAICIS